MVLSRKTFVLDTSVLLSSPKAMFTFDEHEVVLPLVVIKELESKRTDPELGYPARTALRSLEDLRTRPDADIKTGVVINDQGGTVRIEVNHVSQAGLPDALVNDRTHDVRILAVAKNLATEGHDVTVVSKDLPMRIHADILGLHAEGYLNEQVVVDESYTGITTVNVTQATIDELYKNKTIDLDTINHDWDSIPANTGIIVQGPTSTALARITPDHFDLDLIPTNLKAFDVTGRSLEQRIALAHLLDDNIGVVSLGGKAGSGKTYVALAAGLEAVIEKRTHRKIVVFRPLYAVGGQDLGYLPGDANEKMSPWGAAIFDALESMVDKTVIDYITDNNLIEVLPLTHIRGRSLTDTFVIVDEAQSLERPVLLTALSRLGKGSKVVLSWDAAQRDNLRVGRHDGVAAMVERLKGQPLFAHTTFTKSERGPIAAMVTELLDDYGN